MNGKLRASNNRATTSLTSKTSTFTSTILNTAAVSLSRRDNDRRYEYITNARLQTLEGQSDDSDTSCMRCLWVIVGRAVTFPRLRDLIVHDALKFWGSSFS